MKKIELIPLEISLGLVLILLLLLLEYQRVNYVDKLLEFIIQIFGAFVATFLGVYFSLYYTKKQEKEKEERDSNKVFLGSLKLLWAEMDLNGKAVKNILEGFKSMPRIVPKLYNQHIFLLEHSKSIKTNSFYGVITSGGMNEISKNDNIFNALQQAYYNMEMAINGLTLTGEIYKDFDGIKAENVPSDIVNTMFLILDKEIDKLGRTVDFIERAKHIVFEYLSDRGVTFSEDELPS